MLPLFTTVASFVPSSEEVIVRHSFVPVMELSSVHVAPLSLEVHILPSWTVAANFVPSDEEVIDFQYMF